MESLKLDTTQSRNLNFAKLFCVGLLILWGVLSFSAAQTPDLNAQEDVKPNIKICKETIKKEPCLPKNQTL